MAGVSDWSDDELIEEIEELDGRDDAHLSDWELDFYESIRNRETLTAGQREKAVEIVKKYQKG